MERAGSSHSVSPPKNLFFLFMNHLMKKNHMGCARYMNSCRSVTTIEKEDLDRSCFKSGQEGRNDVFVTLKGGGRVGVR